MIIQAGRVKDGRQLFDAVNQAWTRTAEVRQGIDKKDRSCPNCRQPLPLRVFRHSSEFGPRAIDGKATGHQDDHVRRGGGERIPIHLVRN